ncbi:hypothetical protein KXW82_007478, partial [Aspergillus fumigatus]
MTVDDLKTTLRDVIREELSAVGILATTAEQRVKTQSDFDFLRRVHSMWESSVNKVGTAVVLAVMGLAATLVQPDCRSVVVPACEPDVNAEQGADIPALACFQLRLRDTIDYKVDFSQWLQANGNAQLNAANFAAASNSP